MSNSINKNKEECKGCAIVDYCYTPPNCIIDSVLKKCPCITCLIKVMCIRGCEQINDYIDSVPD